MGILKHTFSDCISPPEDTLPENLQILHGVEDGIHRTDVSLSNLILVSPNSHNQNRPSFDLH